MLLPSALTCDLRPRRSRFTTPIRLFSTPPPSDDNGPQGNGLLGTCRALQSLLNGSPAPSPRQAKPERLQSPLQIHPTQSSPHTRSRKQRIHGKSKLSSPAPSTSPKDSRGTNKRRRDCYEEDGDSMMCDADDLTLHPSTPKRSRYVPYDLPLGLSQSDFYSLNSPPITQSPPSPAQRRQQELLEGGSLVLRPFDPDAPLPSVEEPQESMPSEESTWTTDDDQQLVELVLEKFKLSKRDWDECARRMGKNNATVGQRWQALVGEGNVGLRRGRRMVRGRIDKDWM